MGPALSKNISDTAANQMISVAVGIYQNSVMTGTCWNDVNIGGGCAQLCPKFSPTDVKCADTSVVPKVDGCPPNPQPTDPPVCYKSNFWQDYFNSPFCSPCLAYDQASDDHEKCCEQNFGKLDSTYRTEYGCYNKMCDPREREVYINQTCMLTLTQDALQKANIKVQTDNSMNISAKQVAESINQNVGMTEGSFACNIFRICLNLASCIKTSICQNCELSVQANNSVNCLNDPAGKIFITQENLVNALQTCAQQSSIVIKAKQELQLAIDQSAKALVKDAMVWVLLAMAAIAAIFFIGRPLASGKRSKPRKSKGSKSNSESHKTDKVHLEDLSQSKIKEAINTSAMTLKLCLILATLGFGATIFDCTFTKKVCKPAIFPYMIGTVGILYVVFFLFFIKQSKETKYLKLLIK